MFVIDPSGTLVYAGAIDDKRSANVADVKTANNYVVQAFAELRAGKPVSAASTNAYGCTIKFAVG
jgi:sensor domain CHASE-containing protein